MALITGVRVSELLGNANPQPADLFMFARTLSENYKITFEELEQALNKLTTQGDLLTFDGTNTVRLGIGTNNQVLKSNGTSLVWEDFGNYLNNPFTAQGQIIFSDSNNTADILDVGSENQIMTVQNGLPSWSTYNFYESPLTTNGDLLFYNTTESRLSIGAEGEFLKVSGGLPSWQTVNLFEDPLTTEGDLLFYSIGSSKRLPIGTEGQILTVSSGTASWEYFDGYQDPLTTNGDILVRDNGTTSRLGAGSNGQVLTISSGIPSWENLPDNGLFDPTVNTGDIIFRDGGGLAARSIGSEGQVLMVNNGLPSWISIPGLVDADNYFRTISVSGEDSIVASGEADVLTLAAGTGVSLTTDAVAKSVTINSTLSVGADNTIPFSNSSGTGYDHSGNLLYQSGELRILGSSAGIVLGSNPNDFTVKYSNVSSTPTLNIDLSNVDLFKFRYNFSATRYENVSEADAFIVNGVSELNGALAVTGNTNLGGSLSVTGSSSFSDVSTSSSVSVGNNLFVQGSIDFGSGTINLPNNPSTVTIGALRYNQSTEKVQVFDNGIWNDLNSAAPPDTNDYVDSITFNTSNGVLTLGRTGALSDLTRDLDGRWLITPSMTSGRVPYWNGTTFLDSPILYNSGFDSLSTPTWSAGFVFRDGFISFHSAPVTSSSGGIYLNSVTSYDSGANNTFINDIRSYFQPGSLTSSRNTVIGSSDLETYGSRDSVYIGNRPFRTFTSDSFSNINFIGVNKLTSQGGNASLTVRRILDYNSTPIASTTGLEYNTIIGRLAIVDLDIAETEGTGENLAEHILARNSLGKVVGIPTTKTTLSSRVINTNALGGGATIDNAKASVRSFIWKTRFSSSDGQPFIAASTIQTFIDSDFQPENVLSVDIVGHRSDNYFFGPIKDEANITNASLASWRINPVQGRLEIYRQGAYTGSMFDGRPVKVLVTYFVQ